MEQKKLEQEILPQWSFLNVNELREESIEIETVVQLTRIANAFEKYNENLFYQKSSVVV